MGSILESFSCLAVALLSPGSGYGLFKSLAQYWNHKATAVLYQLRPSSSGVKSHQQSILNYHSVFQQTVNSQLSTVNNNSGATGIDMKSPESLKFQQQRNISFPHPVYFV